MTTGETKLVKIGYTFNGSTLFKILKLDPNVSYSQLVAEASLSFGQDMTGCSWSWIDSDNDAISINGDNDVKLFFDVNSQPYKLNLVRMPTMNPKAAEFVPMGQKMVNVAPPPSSPLPTEQKVVTVATRQSSPPHIVPNQGGNVRTIAMPKLNARFVKHTTCDDESSKYAPGTKFFKTWRFRNDGGLKWPKQIHILFVSKLTGDIMGGPEDLVVNFPEQIEIGKEIDICVPLIAPQKTGEYTGFWKLADETSKKFGQRVRVRIHVDEAPPSLGKPSERERTILEQLEEDGFDENAKQTALIALRASKVDLKYSDIETYLGSLGIRQSLN